MMNMLKVVSALSILMIILGMVSIIRGHHRHGKSSRHSKWLTVLGALILCATIALNFHGYQQQFFSLIGRRDVHAAAKRSSASPRTNKDKKQGPHLSEAEQSRQMVNAINNGQATYQDKEIATQKAQNLVDTTGTSESSLYQQLTASPNDLSQGSVQYAIDHIKVDWDQQAVKAAQGYQDNVKLTGGDLYDQLSSPIADQFTPEQAQYATEHV